MRGILTLCVALLWGAGCDRNGSTSQSPTTESTESTASSESEPEQAPSEQGDEWRQVSEDQLDEPARRQLQRARSAQKELGSTLKRELLGAIEESKPAGAVDFCHERAPEIAREVSKSHDLKIGRTSHRLRNPDNRPPSWAEPAVERKEPRSYVMQGPADQLGYLAPIKLGGVCVNCHGKEDQLAPGVDEMLDRHYPEDQATGFAVGDLRGWFWVEVPSS
jgi:hypothetical protein